MLLNEAIIKLKSSRTSLRKKMREISFTDGTLK